MALRETLQRILTEYAKAKVEPSLLASYVERWNTSCEAAPCLRVLAGPAPCLRTTEWSNRGIGAADVVLGQRLDAASARVA